MKLKFWKKPAPVTTCCGCVCGCISPNECGICCDCGCDVCHEHAAPAPADPDSNCWRYAKEELQQGGWLADEGMYGDMIGKAVLDLVKAFAAQGHSGMSADITLALFDRVVRFKPLGEITYEEDQWVKHDYGDNNLWQHKRNSSIFSDDQGRTWYDVDEADSPRHVIEQV